MSAEDAGNVAGWVLEHGQTLFFLLAGISAVVILVRVVYLIALALADLRLRWRGGDTATELAGWLRQQNGGVNPSIRGGPGGRRSWLLRRGAQPIGLEVVRQLAQAQGQARYLRSSAPGG